MWIDERQVAGVPVEDFDDSSGDSETPGHDPPITADMTTVTSYGVHCRPL